MGKKEGAAELSPEKVGVIVGAVVLLIELVMVVISTHSVHEPDLRPFSAIQPK